MKTLYRDEIGIYIIADQARDAESASIMEYQVQERGGAGNQVTEEEANKLILDRIILTLKAFSILKENNNDLSDTLLENSKKRLFRLGFNAGNSQVYLKTHHDPKIRPDEVFSHLYRFSQLVEELSPEFRDQYKQVPWHFLRELREILLNRSVQRDYDLAGDLVKNFIKTLSKAEFDQMVIIFQNLLDQCNASSTSRRFSDDELECFDKIVNLVGFFEDRNLVADRGYRDEQDVVSHFGLMADQTKRDELVNSPAGRLAILRFFMFIAGISKKIHNPIAIRLLENAKFLEIRNEILAHITADKMLYSLVPLLRSDQATDIFTALADLAAQITQELKQIVERRTQEVKDSPDKWQTLQQLPTAETEGGLDVKAIDDFLQRFEQTKSDKVLSDEDFKDFIKEIKDTFGLDVTKRKLSKSEQKKKDKGQEIKVESFDEMIEKFNQEVNKTGQLFGENGVEKLWQICKKFECQKIADDQKIREIIQEKILERKKSLGLEKSLLEKLDDVLLFTQSLFGEELKFDGSDESLERQMSQVRDDKTKDKIRKNYRQFYFSLYTQQEAIDKLTLALKDSPIKLQALELLIVITEAIAREVEKDPEFKQHLKDRYKFACSDHSRNRISHQQSSYFEAEIPHETAFESIMINNHPKAAAQTLSFMLVNLRVVIRDALTFLEEQKSTESPSRSPSPKPTLPPTQGQSIS